MNQYTVGELARNPRSVRLAGLNKQINRDFETKNNDYLDYREENLDFELVTAVVRLLTSSIILNDPQVVPLLTIQAKKLKQLTPKFRTDLTNYLKATQDKQLSKLDDQAFIYASYLAPYVISFRTGKFEMNLVKPNEVTIAHLREMLRRMTKLFDRIGWPNASNISASSKHQVVVGIMDCLVGDQLIEINASPMKNLSSRLLRETLYYYNIMAEPQKGEIKKISVFNPRWNLMSNGLVADINQDVLKTIQNKIDHLDEMMSMSLMDRLA